MLRPIGVQFHRLAIQNLLSYYLADPKHALIAAALLEYRPSLLDILPMYVIFMALTPVAREIARRWSWEPVVYASFASVDRSSIWFACVALPARRPVWAAGARKFNRRLRSIFLAASLDRGPGAREHHLQRPTGLSRGNSHIPEWLWKIACLGIGFLILRYAHWTAG